MRIDMLEYIVALHSIFCVLIFAFFVFYLLVLL
jgi:hypothetical protein